jgi:hypothetical protein
VSNNNFYHETLNRTEGELTEEVLSARISECNMVLGELTNSMVWKTLLNDAKRMIEMIDNNWQDLPDNDPKIREMRVLKMASMHIFELPKKYSEEMAMLQVELLKRQQPEEIIQKDADNEI